MKLSSNNDKSIPPLENPSGFYYGYVIVLCALISVVAGYSLPLSYGIFFKPMVAELNWSRTAISGAYSLSRVVSGLFAIPMGGLSDKVGARIVLIICGVLCGLSYFLIAQVHEVWQLYLVYGVMLGMGTCIFTPMVSTVAKWFVQRRAIMAGIVISGVGFATLVGSPITNLLISLYGWRLSYIIAGVVVAIIILIAAQFMKRDPHQIGQRALGEKNDIVQKAGTGNADFSLREAICTWQFWVFFVMSLCYAFCYMAVVIHVAPYMTDLGISATIAANVMATIGGTVIVSLIGMGHMGDRIGHKKVVIMGFIFFALATTLLLFARELWQFYLFAVLLGSGFGAVASQRPPIVAMLFGVKSHGLIFGVIDNSFTIGAAAGPLLAGYIFDTSGSYLTAFSLNAAISVLGLILIIILKTTITRNSRELAR